MNNIIITYAPPGPEYTLIVDYEPVERGELSPSGTVRLRQKIQVERHEDLVVMQGPIPPGYPGPRWNGWVEWPHGPGDYMECPRCAIDPMDCGEHR